MLKQQNTNIYKWGCTSQETKGFRWISLSQKRRRFSLGLGGPHGRTWGALESNGFVWKFKGNPPNPVVYLFMFPKINGIFFVHTIAYLIVRETPMVLKIVFLHIIEKNMCTPFADKSG